MTGTENHPTQYRDNASDILPYRVSVSAENAEDQMKDVSKAFCPFLRDVLHKDLAVTPLSGGLSNELFVVKRYPSAKQGDDNGDDDETAEQSVLVRIHPSNATTNNSQQQHSIVDRNVENTVCAWLSSQQVGPIYYGRFQNGRVEEFYPHHVTLSYKDMGTVGASHIAPIMAHFHSLQVPPGVLERQQAMPPSSSAANNSNTDKDRGDIFRRVQTWLNMAESHTDAQTNERASQLLPKLKDEWKWLEDALHQPRTTTMDAAAAAHQFLTQIVFTHMDMQSLNFLRHVKNTNTNTTTTIDDLSQQVIKVIDFEYAGFNPRAVDMANTFCEHCDMNNIKADFAVEYPSDAIQNAFVQSYIQHTLTSAKSSSTPKETVQLQELRALIEPFVNDPVFLKAARQEIGRYTLVSHMSWAIWSIVQSNMSDIDFDYVQYAEHRMEGFEYMKKRFFG